MIIIVPISKMNRAQIKDQDFDPLFAKDNREGEEDLAFHFTENDSDHFSLSVSSPGEVLSDCSTIYAPRPLKQFREKHQWYKDEKICSRIALILGLRQIGETARFSSCPDYGTLLESSLYNNDDPQQALFVVLNGSETDLSGRQSALHPTKHMQMAYTANFPDTQDLPPVGPYLVNDQELSLLRRVCSWRGRPAEADDIRFYIWRFDLFTDKTNNSFWVGLVVPHPEKRINPSEALTKKIPKTQQDDPHQRICLEMMQILCEENEMSKKDELFSFLSSEVMLECFCGIEDAENNKSRIRALCIGIDDYEGRYDTLRNCERDARLFESSFLALPDATVEVVASPDASKVKIMQRLDKFIKSLNTNQTEIVVLTFAGHAVQLKGHIYLLPADFPAPMREQTVLEQAVSFSEVYASVCEAISESRTAALFVIDACRSAPPGATWKLPSDFDSLLALLDKMQRRVRALTLLSSGGGEVACDGEGENSLFATILCQELFGPHSSTVLKGAHDACIRFFEQGDERQIPGIVGCFPGHLKLSRRAATGLEQAMERRLQDAPEEVGRVTELLGLVGDLLSEVKAAAHQARVAMLCNAELGDEEARRRMQSYRAQRLLLEVTPKILAVLMERCWLEKGMGDWSSDNVRAELEGRIRPGELSQLRRAGMDLGEWATWDITGFCAVRCRASPK